MTKRIKKFIKNHIVLYNTCMKLYDIYDKKWKRSFFYWVCFKNLIFWIGYIGRLLRISGKKYDKIEQLKSSESGRCFIVATGPSLTIDDVKKLKNEKTFGVNSLCKIFEQLDWETTYYVIQDRGVFHTLYEEIRKFKTTMFIHADQHFEQKYLAGIKCEKYIFPRYYGNHIWNRRNLKTGFSKDARLIIHEGYTVAYVALQLAAYMGFKEIYLLGADCNYSKDENKQHFVKSGYYATNYATIGNEMLYAYSVAKKELDRMGVKVFNATRGGMLEIFPRVDLDEVLKKMDK